MKEILNPDFLQSIVWVEEFDCNKKNVVVKVLCIEENIEVLYRLSLSNIIAFIFRQEDPNEEFSVIDTFLEPFNDCSYLDFMHSETKAEYWAIRFHSGLHHLVIGFKEATVLKL